MTETTTNSKIYAALARAQAMAKAVEKDGEYRGGSVRYGYASAEAILTESKACLAPHGLSAYPATSAVVETPYGLMLIQSWIVAHESGDWISAQVQWPICPGPGRPLDKAVASARTSSMSYFLRDLLMLPRVDESDEMDSSTRQPEPPRGGPADFKVRVTKPPEVKAPSDDKVKAAEAMRSLRDRIKPMTDVAEIRECFAGWGSVGPGLGLPPAQVEGARAFVEAVMLLVEGKELSTAQAAIVKRVDQL